MITAADSSVLLDILGAHPQYGSASANALKHAISEGRVVACPIVWSEVSTVFPNENALVSSMEAIPITFSELDGASAFVAGRLWKKYRDNRGPRTRMLADFLIGAHALERCDRLLTRDLGFFRTYFKDLKIIIP
ncbi:MAG: type II toxin-antitoxin system VapC family toxin [Prolixibacteraceae bacterium]|nr:type II toxin-antitoxin system VapC family toxin [Burkholderiales bacterium]